MNDPSRPGADLRARATRAAARRLSRALVVAVVVGLAVGGVACGQDDPAKPAGRASDGLLDGGPDAFEAKLAQLRESPS